MFLLSLQVLNWNTVYVFAMFMHANIVIINIHMQEKTTFFLKKIPGLYRQVATDAIGTIQREMKEKGINPERQTPSGCRVQGL
jgi:hypothetical protein